MNLGCGRWKSALTMMALSASLLLFGARTLRADAYGVLGGAINAGGDCEINSPQPNARGSFMDAAGLNQGGNKADNIGLPKASAPLKCASFPAVGPCE